MAEAINNAFNNMPAYRYTNFNPRQKEKESIFLEQKLDEISDKQGMLGNLWNGIKELTTLGTSESDCEKMLEKFNSGEFSFEEAINYIDAYDRKQSNASGLMTNILTGIGAIAFATSVIASGGKAGILGKIADFAKIGNGGLNWANSIKLGAPVGAVLKTAIGITDRATNDTEGDALDGKKVAKDFISGAMTGAASAVSSGVGVGIKNKDIALSIKNGAICGLTCGSASGALNYTTDAILEEDVEFNFGDLAKNTITSAAVSGVVGAGVGAGMYGAATQGIGGTVGQETTKSLGQTITQDCTTSSLRKALGQGINSIGDAINN